MINKMDKINQRKGKRNTSTDWSTHRWSRKVAFTTEQLMTTRSTHFSDTTNNHVLMTKKEKCADEK
jgi:hypothetical protein